MVAALPDMVLARRLPNQAAVIAVTAELVNATTSKPFAAPRAPARRDTSSWSRAPIAATKLATMANSSAVILAPVHLPKRPCLR